MSTRQDASSLDTVVPEPGSASDIGIEPERPSTNISDISKQVVEEGAKVDEQTIRVDDGNVPAPPRRPARPERRLSEFSSRLQELQAAFPDSDESICRGVLVAASSNLEAAFSGMLAISDETIRPDIQRESQIERDGQLARRIALSDQRRQTRSNDSSRLPRSSATVGRYSNQRSQQESETDDFQRGLNEAKESISSFWGSLKQKLSGEIYDENNENDIAIDPNIRRSGSATNQPWFSRDNGFHDNELDDGIIRNDPMYKVDTQLPTRSRIPPLPARSNNAERSVNVFGDDSSNTDAIKKVDDPEPDSFFIGESDEEDLGSLRENDDQNKAVATCTPESKTKESSSEIKSDTVGDTPNEKEIRRGSASSTKESAKEALTKLKLTDEGKM